MLCACVLSMNSAQKLSSKVHKDLKQFLTECHSITVFIVQESDNDVCNLIPITNTCEPRQVKQKAHTGWKGDGVDNNC